MFAVAGKVYASRAPFKDYLGFLEFSFEKRPTSFTRSGHSVGSPQLGRHDQSDHHRKTSS